MKVFGQLDWDKLFIPECFRTPTANLSVQGCLTGAISHYAQILFVLVGVVSFLMLLSAGYQMFTAFGDEAKYVQAKKTITYALVGIIIAVLAGTLVGIYTGILGYRPRP